MGYTLSQAAFAAGADVTLISGPTQLHCAEQIKRIDVITAQQMHETVMAEIKNYDVFIGAAAVSDYRLENIASQKIKKTEQNLTLNLISNPDIIAAVAALVDKPLMVGFALETENLINNAKIKLNQKNLDMIVANAASALGNEKNSVTTIYRDGAIKNFTAANKGSIAAEIINLIADDLVKTDFPVDSM